VSVRACETRHSPSVDIPRPNRGSAGYDQDDRLAGDRLGSPNRPDVLAGLGLDVRRRSGSTRRSPGEVVAQGRYLCGRASAPARGNQGRSSQDASRVSDLFHDFGKETRAVEPVHWGRYRDMFADVAQSRGAEQGVGNRMQTTSASEMPDQVRGDARSGMSHPGSTAPLVQSVGVVTMPQAQLASPNHTGPRKAPALADDRPWRNRSVFDLPTASPARLSRTESRQPRLSGISTSSFSLMTTIGDQPERRGFSWRNVCPSVRGRPHSHLFPFFPT